MAAETFGLASKEAALPAQAISGLAGSILFGYSVYGLYKAMLKIRLQME